MGLSTGVGLLAVLTHLLVAVDVSVDLLELQFLWNTLLDDVYLKKSGFMLSMFPPLTFPDIMAMPTVCSVLVPKV